jgi:hypothetical protein
MLTSDRSAQVLLLYHRQNYDRGSEALGLGRAARYFAAEVDGIDQGVQTTRSSGTATLYRVRRGIIEGRTGNRLKHLKRKENAPIVSFEFVSAQKSTIPDETVKRNNIDMLAHRFCIAPMMDWSESSIFSKCWKTVCARCVHREIKENLATNNVSVQRINCPSTQICKP